MSKNYIICPHCGAEYLPCELYLPNSFLGHPSEIQKDSDGKIINIFGKDMDLNEFYRCDYCNKKFTVSAKIKFIVDSNTKDFDNQYKTKLTKPGLFLDEE